MSGERLRSSNGLEGFHQPRRPRTTAPTVTGENDRRDVVETVTNRKGETVETVARWNLPIESMI